MLAKGTVIGSRYRIVNALGAGSFGQTYLAEDTQKFNDKVVVKRLQPVTTTPGTVKIARRKFEEEALALSRLGQYDRIPTLYAYFQENDEFYLVQEYVGGQDLTREILEREPWSEDKAISFLQDVLESLEVVHHHQCIHRDLKPANLIRRYKDGRIVLIDFGAVKEFAATEVLNSRGETKIGTIIGTPIYMPNEQANGDTKFNSDIYALGIVAIQALSGQRPETIEKDPHTGEIILPNMAIREDFKTLLRRMVACYFANRYQSASEVLQDLESLGTVAVNSGVRTRTSPSTSAKFEHMRQKRPWWHYGLGATGAIAAVGLVFFGIRNFVNPEILPQPQELSFGEDGVLDIGVLSVPRPNVNPVSEYERLVEHLEEQFGSDRVRLHALEIWNENAISEARKQIATKKWDIAFTLTPLVSATAIESDYLYVARMFPERPEFKSVFFVLADSPIQSVDEIDETTTVALGPDDNIFAFHLPVYDLFGKTLRLDLDNRGLDEVVAKLSAGSVDVAAWGYFPPIQDPAKFRVLEGGESRAIPAAAVYISPEIDAAERQTIVETLLNVPQEIQAGTKYGQAQEHDYTHIVNITRRAAEIQTCSNLKQLNSPQVPVTLKDCSSENLVVGRVKHYDIIDNNTAYRLSVQGTDGEDYQVLLSRQVLNSDPNLSDILAIFGEMIQVEIEGQSGQEVINITEPGQLQIIS